MQKKPAKKTDQELWGLISEKISSGNYLFLRHAKERLVDRNISDLEVINILENKHSRKRSRNKSKDIYMPGYEDWITALKEKS
jgi:hypothetical protein